MKTLVLVESPSKAKTIKKYLGKDYKVMATVGHVIDLPKSKLGVDLENDYAPEFATIKGKGPIIKKIKKAIPKGGRVLLAMDPDREGEAIAWHIGEALKLKKPKRVVFHEITKDAVKKAIEQPRDIDMGLVDAQVARRVLDRLVGYKVSELLWKKIWYGLSAGRVQSAALRLIVEREREIEAFVPEEYWKVSSDLKSPNNSITANLDKIEGKKAVVGSKKDFDGIKKDLKGKTLEVADIKSREVTTNPYPPFTTSTLQQAANNLYGYTARRTMGLAQALYQAGFITYMRTDSVSLSTQALKNIRGYISKTYDKEYLPDAPREYKSKSKNAQEAHEAIRPTDVNADVAKIKADLGGPEAKLYSLILSRTVASQMASKKALRLTVKLEGQGVSKKVYMFKLGGEKVLFDGFRKLWGNKSKNGDSDGIQHLEEIDVGEVFDIKKINGEQHFTKPVPRYTDASLVKALEEHGIGRPSTYATIISTVQSRGYVCKDGRSLFPLDVGRVVSDFLTENFNRLVDYEYTATVEDDFDRISHGKEKYEEFIGKEYKPLVKEINKAEKNVVKEDVVILGDSDEKCEKCGSKMVVRLGRYGKFLSCSTFPECKGMKSLDEDLEEVDFDRYAKPKPCPECKKEMILKSGRYGLYWGCKDYPEDCKGTSPLLLKEKCPECGELLVERKSKWGSIFIGCSGYPDCTYIKKEPKKGKGKKK